MRGQLCLLKTWIRLVQKIKIRKWKQRGLVLFIRSWSTCFHCYYRVMLSWWRHEMEKISALLAFWAWNSPVPGEFPAQRPVARSFNVFFDLCLNKRLNKQSRHRWFETPSGSLWRHCKVNASLSSFESSYMYVYFFIWLHSRSYKSKTFLPLYFSTVRCKQNGQRFADGIFKCIFVLNGDVSLTKFHWSFFLEVTEKEWLSISLDNGLALNRRKAITSPNVDKIHGAIWRH